MPDDQFFCKQCFMKKMPVLLSGSLIVLLVFVFCQGCKEDSGVMELEQSLSATRIVSTVPSITEVLFDIGAGDRIVGDSKFTVYPPEAAEIDKIGGLYDIDLEKIVSLRPDLVVTLVENDSLRTRLTSFGIKSISVDHRSFRGVLDSYETIGEAAGPEILENARLRQNELKQRVDAFEQESRQARPVRVLLCVDRTRGTGRIQNLYAAGTNPFYEEVLRLAGGINVASETGVPFPNLTAESVIHLAPDVIVELFTGEGMTSATGLDGGEKQAFTERILADWKTVPGKIPAVDREQVYVIMEDFATIPGPRTPLLIESLREILRKSRVQTSTSPTR